VSAFLYSHISVNRHAVSGAWLICRGDELAMVFAARAGTKDHCTLLGMFQREAHHMDYCDSYILVTFSVDASCGGPKRGLLGVERSVAAG
jgi:hypothetical protein